MQLDHEILEKTLLNSLHLWLATRSKQGTKTHLQLVMEHMHFKEQIQDIKREIEAQYVKCNEINILQEHK